MEFNSSVHKHMHKCGQSDVFPRRVLLNYQFIFPTRNNSKKRESLVNNVVLPDLSINKILKKFQNNHTTIRHAETRIREHEKACTHMHA